MNISIKILSCLCNYLSKNGYSVQIRVEEPIRYRSHLSFKSHSNGSLGFGMNKLTCKTMIAIVRILHRYLTKYANYGYGYTIKIHIQMPVIRRNNYVLKRSLENY